MLKGMILSAALAAPIIEILAESRHLFWETIYTTIHSTFIRQFTLRHIMSDYLTDILNQTAQMLSLALAQLRRHEAGRFTRASKATTIE